MPKLDERTASDPSQNVTCNRAVEIAQFLKGFIEEAKNFQERTGQRECLGLRSDAVNFCHVTLEKEAAMRELGGATLRTIAVQLTESVLRLVTADSAKREPIQAKQHLLVKTGLCCCKRSRADRRRQWRLYKGRPGQWLRNG
jgi:hypothetical protein